MIKETLNILEKKNYFDKSQWERGEWDNEPDRIYWIDSKTGYHCIIRRICFGFLCGYVAIKKNHPLYKKFYDDINSLKNVHGGVTYSELCKHELGVCLLTKEKDKSWWIGFDCGHFFDYQPANLKEFSNKQAYRNISYVISEVESLAKQLKELEND